jgi:hypothetical protein
VRRSNADAYTNGYLHTNSDAYSDIYAYSYGYGYGDIYANANSDSHTTTVFANAYADTDYMHSLVRYW